MRICTVQPYCPPDADPAPSDYLARYPLLRYLPRELVGLGHHVDVVVEHMRDARHDEHSVSYHMVAERHAAAMVGSALARMAGMPSAHWVPARSTIARVVQLRPDVVHVHGMVPHVNLVLLERTLRRHGIPWVAQHHGGQPARRWWARRLQKRWMGAPSALVFTSREHARPYVDADLLPDGLGRVVEVVETSSALRRQDPQSARQRTGFDGEPVLLSVARLHPVKDPLTMLRGVEVILDALPSAQLHCVYRSAELLQEVADFLQARPRMAARTTLHGEAATAQMEAIYSSADFLVQASQREFSGCAVLEAMSCSVIPVISDIPASRAILGDDLDRLLFEVGDSVALARQLLAVWAEGAVEVARRVTERFDDHLSFAAMAKRLAALYACILSQRRSSSSK